MEVLASPPRVLFGTNDARKLTDSNDVNVGKSFVDCLSNGSDCKGVSTAPIKDYGGKDVCCDVKAKVKSRDVVESRKYAEPWKSQLMPTGSWLYDINCIHDCNNSNDENNSFQQSENDEEEKKGEGLKSVGEEDGKQYVSACQRRRKGGNSQKRKRRRKREKDRPLPLPDVGTSESLIQIHTVWNRGRRSKGGHVVKSEDKILRYIDSSGTVYKLEGIYYMNFVIRFDLLPYIIVILAFYSFNFVDHQNIIC